MTRFTLTLRMPAGRAKLALVLAFDLAFAAALALPGVWSDSGVRIPVLVCLAGFLAWQAALALDHLRNGRPLVVIESHFRRVHLLQAGFQSLVMIYWGLSYRDVFPHYVLIFIQLAFAYLLELGLAWSLRRAWYLGLGPLPIVISTNLFIWFEHDTFWIQLALIAVGVLSKVFLTWKRDGQRTHIFNPSGLPLALISLALLVLHRTDLGRGADFPLSFDLAPSMIDVLFLVGLLVNTQFQTVLLTGSAVVTLFAVNAVTRSFTGLNLSLLLSAPVFLGATLLFTDPATTPSSKSGKGLSGALYGILISVLAVLLISLQLPPYYDKVLAVPLVNLMTPQLESAGRRLDAAFARLFRSGTKLLASHRVHVALWILFFVGVDPVGREQARSSLFQPPSKFAATPEFATLLRAHFRLCDQRPDVCQRHGLIAELFYRLGL